MNKLDYRHFKVSKSNWILFFSLLLACMVQANPLRDTSKKILTDIVSKASVPASQESNVIFPDVLTGNEDEALLYIEKFAMNRRSYLINMYNRSTSFFAKAGAILQEFELPQELKILVALESAFNGNAVSRAGAVGYWQIMDVVAREYGLKYVSKGGSVKRTKGKKGLRAIARDDRKNFDKSTYAAARYLKDRSKNLNGNLLLMVASYNCGVGNVWEAIKKSGLDNPSFWDIKEYL
ncbi:MAG TPA: transglycosylase SLT domain-containing protein, partial [Ferruginibacter sp.]|nr:transglycosylase SLT domain-containing protein [Ferruginibacter sp.]